jgi:hypothetical protein
VLELITNKGICEEDVGTSGSVRKIATELHDIRQMYGSSLQFVVCRRESTALTLFDTLLARLHVAVMVVGTDSGVLYPANVIKRRAAGVCVDVT